VKLEAKNFSSSSLAFFGIEARIRIDGFFFLAPPSYFVSSSASLGLL